jgi:hypothetical protein
MSKAIQTKENRRLNVSDAILAIRYPKDGKIRSRKVISRSKASSSGKYPSWKMGRMLQWESPHELNAFRLLDANPAVARFEEQPLVVSFVLDGIEHDHYPDIEVQVNGVKELWEVKTQADASRPEVSRRTELMTKALPTHGYKYRVAIAEELTASPRLQNALTMLRSGRGDIHVVERERLRLILKHTQKLTWSDVLAGALGVKSKAHACRLILEGALYFDMGKALEQSTVIGITGAGSSHRGVFE